MRVASSTESSHSGCATSIAIPAVADSNTASFSSSRLYGSPSPFSSANSEFRTPPNPPSASGSLDESNLSPEFSMATAWLTPAESRCVAASKSRSPCGTVTALSNCNRAGASSARALRDMRACAALLTSARDCSAARWNSDASPAALFSARSPDSCTSDSPPDTCASRECPERFSLSCARSACSITDSTAVLSMRRSAISSCTPFPACSSFASCEIAPSIASSTTGSSPPSSSAPSSAAPSDDDTASSSRA
mmetsp:Transcript_54153/g.123708  ORF Transcript_54153/g.123708 Transcript_54153/m.123708 type:complete len:251 (-) Transcript_54153:205-957(-)